MDKSIRSAKEQAYNRGYIAGYQQGIEDSISGKAGFPTETGLLDQPIHFLNLSKRPFNSLDRAGYCTIRDIVSLKKREIWMIRGLGIKGLHEIARALWDCGIQESEWNEWLYWD